MLGAHFAEFVSNLPFDRSPVHRTDRARGRGGGGRGRVWFQRPSVRPSVRPFVHPTTQASAHSMHARIKQPPYLERYSQLNFLKPPLVLLPPLPPCHSDDVYETGPILTCLLSSAVLSSPLLRGCAAPSCFAHRFSWNPAISKTRERTPLHGYGQRGPRWQMEQTYFGLKAGSKI